MFIAFLIIILVQFNSYSNYSVPSFKDGDEEKNIVPSYNANGIYFCK